jgi:transcriptional regulator with XRE-family HTH domain
MGRRKREEPKRLMWKLREIRLRLGLSQEAMYEILKTQGASIHLGYVSLYEIGERTPSLLVVLAYAKAAGISTDLLIDDSVELPDKLPLR